MKEFAIATVIMAVAAVGVTAVNLICTQHVIKLCDEARRDTQENFSLAMDAARKSGNPA